MAEIDTWMPWHIAEYLADTMHLSTLEHGAYLLILGHGWRNDGTIVASDAYLAGITRLPRDQWKSVRPTLEAFFDAFQHPTLGLCWRQKRQVMEIAKAKAMKTKAQEKSKKALAARWPESSKDSSKHSLEESSRSPQGFPSDGKGKDFLDPPPEEKIALGYKPPIRSEEACALAAERKGDPVSAKDEFWIPLCVIFGLKPRTVADEQRLYQQCLDFRLKEATATEVQRRAANYKLHFPSVAFTPNAVLNQWDFIADPPAAKPGQKKTVAVTDTTAVDFYRNFNPERA